MYDKPDLAIPAASFKTKPDTAADPCFGAPRYWGTVLCRDGGMALGGATPLQLTLEIKRHNRELREPEPYNDTLAKEILLGTRGFSFWKRQDRSWPDGPQPGDVWYDC